MDLDRDEALRRLAAADHAILATLNRTGAADLVPVCFSLIDDIVAVPVDSLKPKRSTALGRIRNLERDPRATLLADHWDPADWSRLWWVRLSLVTRPVERPIREQLEADLRARYPQYRDAPFEMVLTFRIDAVTGWDAAR